MFSILHVLICGVAALAVWTTIGLAFTGRMTDRFTALGMAPIVGWAVQSTLALPLLWFTGTSPVSASLALLLPAGTALCAQFYGRSYKQTSVSATNIVALAASAGFIAAIMTAAITPKYADGGIVLSATIFDHTKVAIIDEIRRNGLPAINPFVADPAVSSHLAYYYLWHFSAAMLAFLTGASSWEAEVGLTWFTLLASLSAMFALAYRIGGNQRAVWWVFPVALAGSLRLVLEEIFGWDFVTFTFGYRTGFSGWAFQSTWAPQHIAGATCATIGIFLLARLARRPRFLEALVLGLLAAASFESSTWIGGIVFPMAAILAAIPLLILTTDNKAGFVRCVLIAGVLTVVLSVPFLIDQLRVSSLRASGLAIGLAPFGSLGDDFPDRVRTLLDPVSYWVLTLPLELSASYIVGCWALVRYWRNALGDRDRMALMIAASALILWSLLVGAFFVSKLAHNNDLAWRGVLPASILLISFAAAGLGSSWRTLSRSARIATLALLLLAFEDTRGGLSSTLFQEPSSTAQAFAKSADMWVAVRRHAGPTDRVANNPDYLEHVFPWPINASWAFWSNRRSCYANEDLVGPFSSFGSSKREATNQLFTSLFAGTATTTDVATIKSSFDCRFVVVTPEDGLWRNDAILLSGGYELVESSTAWRIYRVAANR
ncbi:MAG: hypothetical protein K2W78_15335 [Xanthobacteraceae bacterium]|nr:hypothetical protein [Xanthobacteraceae bacterium]